MNSYVTLKKLAHYSLLRSREFHFFYERLVRGGANHRDIDVVLHVGQPKTGSSAIQRFSLFNRGYLLRAGYFYPMHDLSWTGVSGGHAALIKSITEEDSVSARLILDRLVGESRQLGGVLILSHEGLYSSAKLFRSLLNGLRVRVVGWFRHPVDAYLSQIGQGVKRSFFTTSPLEEVRRYMANKYRSNLEGQYLCEWADNFGEDACVFLPYLPVDHPEFRLIEEQWTDVLDIPAGLRRRFYDNPRLVNRGYALDAIELRRAMNHVLKATDSSVCEIVDNFLQDYSDRQKSFNPLIAAIPKSMVEKLVERFSEPVKMMVERFPALGPVADVSPYLIGSAGHIDGPVDFSEVVEEFRSCHPREFLWFQQRVAAEVGTGRVRDEVFIRLAGMLGVANGLVFD